MRGFLILDTPRHTLDTLDPDTKKSARKMMIICILCGVTEEEGKEVEEGLGLSGRKHKKPKKERTAQDDEATVKSASLMKPYMDQEDKEYYSLLHREEGALHLSFYGNRKWHCNLCDQPDAPSGKLCERRPLGEGCTGVARHMISREHIKAVMGELPELQIQAIREGAGKLKRTASGARQANETRNKAATLRKAVRRQIRGNAGGVGQADFAFAAAALLSPQ